MRDALAKHKPDCCSLGPTKELEEKELLALAANKDISFNYTPKPIETVPTPAKEVIVMTSNPGHYVIGPADVGDEEVRELDGGQGHAGRVEAVAELNRPEEMGQF
ncbi:hypothetical protein L3X38_032674 [Prunus dulcis]|uniref:Uncharacterized protein n=1 Tax=Prunus dulcis TaxID=3755 RepID=A0AAD4YV62_PRUDU|nr:hypothetical protein L3X38_032674 [Prunus dulcis]